MAGGATKEAIMRPCQGTEIHPHEPLWHNGPDCPYCRDIRLLNALRGELKRMGVANDELCDQIYQLEHPVKSEEFLKRP